MNFNSILLPDTIGWGTWQTNKKDKDKNTVSRENCWELFWKIGRATAGARPTRGEFSKERSVFGVVVGMCVDNKTKLLYRVCVPPEHFLVVLYSPLHSRPEFYQVNTSDGKPDLQVALYTSYTTIRLPNVRIKQFAKMNAKRWLDGTPPPPTPDHGFTASKLSNANFQVGG